MFGKLLAAPFRVVSAATKLANEVVRPATSLVDLDKVVDRATVALDESADDIEEAVDE